MDDPAHRRRRDPAAGGVIEGPRVALRFVHHHQHDVSGRVHGKGADKRRYGGVLTVAPHRQLIRGAGFTADGIALGGGLAPGAAVNDQAHQAAHLFRGFFRQHPFARGRAGSVAFQHRRRHVTAAVYQGGDAAGQLQGRNGNAMAISNRHGVDLTPPLRHQGLADFRQLQGRRAQQAETVQVVPLGLGADVDGHLGGADIGRIDDDLRHRQPAILGVKITDGKPGNLDRLAGVITAVEIDRA